MFKKKKGATPQGNPWGFSKKTIMRKITEIIVHCSDTEPLPGYGARQIRNHHIYVNGWRNIGYHYVIRTDGTIEKGRNIEEPGAHCQGHNAHSIGICYVGGRQNGKKGIDTRTQAQKLAMKKLIGVLKETYGCQVHSHHFYNPHKTCPNFDAETEY